MIIETLIFANHIPVGEILGFLSPFVILWVAIVIATFAVTIYFFNNKKQKAVASLQKKLKDYKIHLQRAKETNDKLKENFEKFKKLYENDENKIKELNQYISELEETNKELLDKKLAAESKIIELEELRKKKDELYALNIHDLKNPINVIKGYVDLVKSYDLSLEEQTQILDSIMRSTDKLMEIVNKLTEAIRDDIDLKTKKEKVSLNEIINKVCVNNAAYLRNKKMSLKSPTDMELPDIKVDASKIETAIDNLLNNAIKYGPEGTHIEIATKFDDNNVYLEISDDGPGITEEDQINIFEKGTVSQNKPTGGESQSGLGLWIVKQIIEEHGGDITLKSQKGKGTVFTIKLPLEEEE